LSQKNQEDKFFSRWFLKHVNEYKEYLKRYTEKNYKTKQHTLESFVIAQITKKNKNIRENELTPIQIHFDNELFAIEKMKGDGDCFFNTIITALKSQKNNSEVPSVKDLRNLVAINFTEDMFQSLKTLSIVPTMLAEVQNYGYRKNNNNNGWGTIEDVQNYIRTQNFWANEFAINVIEKKYKIRVIILENETFKIKHQVQNELENPRYIIDVYENNNHYNLVTYDKKKIFKSYEKLPKEIKDALTFDENKYSFIDSYKDPEEDIQEEPEEEQDQQEEQNQQNQQDQQEEPEERQRQTEKEQEKLLINHLIKQYVHPLSEEKKSLENKIILNDYANIYNLFNDYKNDPENTNKLIEVVYKLFKLKEQIFNYEIDFQNNNDFETQKTFLFESLAFCIDQ